MVPYLDLSAESTTTGDATVVVTVNGPANNPKFDFSSIPALPEDEVLARLIFGRSMSRLSPLQIAQLAEAAAQFAGVGGSTSLLENLRSELGVDDLDVTTDDQGGTSVAAGKYLNDRTYVTIEKGDRAGFGQGDDRSECRARREAARPGNRRRRGQGRHSLPLTSVRRHLTSASPNDRRLLMRRPKLDATTWAQLNQLLDSALDQPASAWDQWVDQLGPEHAALKPRLRELLRSAADRHDPSFLETLPKFYADLADFPDVAIDGDRPGDAVGPYRLVRQLGSGGMGVVWLAERSDGLVNRPVALKLPHQAWQRTDLSERMAREREILATLTHPNIARLYDAGLTEAHRPFLAIEYVEGRPIDEYCRDRQLDTQARVRLFAQVANAVAYAHAKLVVHRDLKPANILVTADGQIRLLDFGIAKLLDQQQAKATALTEFTGQPLTPDYASPEQIRGEPLTIGSDIYSLGVVLYELLSGTRPYKLKRDSRGALEDAILEADPPPPSDVAEPPRRRSLRGDLDTIVLRTLKKKPDERYPTVHAFADDLERYLDGRPVLARSDGLWYRVRKFAARNAIAVAAAAAVLAAIIIGATVATWQARVALAEKTRAEEVTALITSVFRDADPTQVRGKVLSAADLLRQAERRLHGRSDVNPETQLELLAIIGESLFGLQENADAARVIEEALHLQESARIADDLSKRDSVWRSRRPMSIWGNTRMRGASSIGRLRR